MVKWTCEKCGKVYTRKDAYNIHMDRKYPCVAPVVEEVKSQHEETMELYMLQNIEFKAQNKEINQKLQNLTDMFAKYIELHP